MDDSDDDYFSDDGFDDLPPSTLLQLEQNAFNTAKAQSAQQAQNGFAQRVQKQQPANLRAATTDQSLYDSNEYGHLDVGEPDAEVVDNGNGPIPAVGHRSAFAKGFTYDEDHHMEDLRPPEQSANVQTGGWQQAQVPTEQMETEEVYIVDETIIPQQQTESGEMEELRARVEELARQNEQMKQELAAARSNVETRAGEIAIIRSNLTKAVQEHDRQITALQKRIAEKDAMHKEEVETVRAKCTTLAAENAFLKQDLAEESRKVSELKAKNKSQQKVQPVTPKKTKVLPFRDGFDDDEIAVLSPSKTSGGRSKRGTPTGHGKRKRKPSQDSPIRMAPLQLGSSQNMPLEETSSVAEADPMTGVEYEQHSISQKDDQNLRFVKWILNHRTPPNKERDLEVMTKLAFPSEPDRTFSSIVLNETSTLRSSNYPVGYAHSIMSLWSRALKEKFFKPVYMFMAIIKFILLLDTTSIAPELIERLVPVLQESVEVNAVTRFHHSPMSRQNLGQFKQTPRSKLHLEVDSTEALRILYLMATGCMHDEDAMRTFWKHIRYDFILMMLNPAQPISDITITLNLLTVSLRQDSFGPILGTDKDQSSNENYILERVANLLSEQPQVDEGQKPYMPAEVCDMRLEALSFLTAVAFSAPNPANNHGCSVMAAHPTALARLFRAMHDEVDALYSYTPEHELHTALVNELMSLIYGVTRKHRDIDLHAKLGLVPGGKQKYLVVLTRLAFSEGPLLEAGITDDTVDMAHEMLEDAVNPEEAETLVEAFPSAQRDG